MTMLDLPESTRAILAALEDFMSTEVVRRYDESADLFSAAHLTYSPTGRYTDEVLEHRRAVRVASAKYGFYSMFAPESIGGGGQNGLTWFAVWERLFHKLGAKYSILGHEVIAHWAYGPSQVLAHASDEVKETVVPGLIAGDTTLCFGMSEPDAGSDIWKMKTRAVADGTGWLINGSKQWTTNGPYADYSLVFAVTDPALVHERRGGISLFLVPTRSGGFSCDRVIRMYGHAGGNEGTLALQDVRVPGSALIAGEGEGLEIGLSVLSLGRLYNAAKSVGLARWAFEQSVNYAKQRTSFGKTLIQHQALGFMMADAATEILSAHLLGLHAARRFDEGDGALVETSMAKMYGSEIGAHVVDRAMQIFGGMGLTNELGLAQAWQELRSIQIADGSAEMLRRVIAGRLAQQIPAL